MATIAKIKSGRKAKSNGSSFESILVMSAMIDGWLPIQIGSMVRWIGKNKFVPIKSPFDFVFLRDKESIFVDAKYTEQASFSYSKLTDHQIESLGKVRNQGFLSGYIVNFESLKKVVFFDTKKLKNLRPYESLSPEDGVLIGDQSAISLEKILTQQKEGQDGR